MEAARKPRNWLRTLLGVALAAFLLAFVVVVGLALYGWSAFSRQVVSAMNANAIIAEHLGEIRAAELHMTATAHAPGDEVFVYTVVGSKGTGEVAAQFITIDWDHEQIRSGTLKLPDGRTFDLVVEGGRNEEN